MIRTVTVLALCLGLAPLANGTQQDTAGLQEAMKLEQLAIAKQRAQLEQDAAMHNEALKALAYDKRNLEMEIENKSVSSWRERLSTLESMAFEMRLSRAEFGARRLVMERHVVELEAQITLAIEDDAMTVHLKQSMKKMEDLLSVFSGAGRTIADTFEGHFRLAELAVELGARSDQVFERSGGTRLQSLKDRLLDVDIELNVLDAREAALQVEMARVDQSRIEADSQRRHLSELEFKYQEIGEEYSRARYQLGVMDDAR